MSSRPELKPERNLQCLSWKKQTSLWTASRQEGLSTQQRMADGRISSLKAASCCSGQMSQDVHAFKNVKIQPLVAPFSCHKMILCWRESLPEIHLEIQYFEPEVPILPIEFHFFEFK